ncbi:unnamed protein product [Protopolystoma xenopodis]|uniref:Uncharacterized protein n=1 Tax=Protopolystoma xenopodis TaxID=117903 RepID=A0A448X5B7_9PLAT|nr:unnamed protein product [Protopolystoma xenopodis]
MSKCSRQAERRDTAGRRVIRKCKALIEGFRDPELHYCLERYFLQCALSLAREFDSATHDELAHSPYGACTRRRLSTPRVTVSIVQFCSARFTKSTLPLTTDLSPLRHSLQLDFTRNSNDSSALVFTSWASPRPAHLAHDTTCTTDTTDTRIHGHNACQSGVG